MGKTIHKVALLTLSFGMLCCVHSNAQPIGLLHSLAHSAGNGETSHLRYLEEDSVFVYQMYGGAISNPSNYGLWEEALYQPQFSPSNNISFFLDQDWNLMGTYENGESSIYTSYPIYWFHYRDSVALSSINTFGANYSGGNYPTLGDFQSFGVVYMLFGYHTTEEWVKPQLFFDNGSGIFPALFPPPCFANEINLNGGPSYNVTFGHGVSVNDSISILIAPMRSSGDVNLDIFLSIGEDNTGYVMMKYNHNTGAFTAESVYSEGDIIGFHGLSESRDDDTYYAVKTIFGEDPVFDMSGQILPNATDTAYTCVVSRENIDGMAEWVNILYEYNNSLSSDVNSDCMIATSRQGNILEVGGKLFCHDHTMLGIYNPLDTVLYKDFMGDVYTFNLNDDLIFTTNQNFSYLMAKSRVYVVGIESGEKYGMVEVDGNVVRGNSSGYEMNQVPTIFDVGDSLAFATDYKAQNDTTIQFNIKLMDGSVTAHQINLPAGYSSVVIWLDDELNVLDEWVFSGTIEDNGFARGIRISEIAPFGQDSIILAATIDQGVTIDMGISGAPQPEFYSSRTTFLGIYGPTNSVGVREMKDNLKFSVYPNPASDQLQIALSQRSETTTYSMFDVSGREVQSGTFSSASQVESISVSDLKQGIYFLKVQSGDVQGVKKLVVE